MNKILRYPKLISIALLAVLLVVAVFPAPVYAIADPDTPPSVNAVYVYEDLLEDGDCGVLIDYFLDYAVPPTETATEAFLAAFIDTDGTTQLKAVAPYAFDDNGYGRGLMWIYFSAAEVVTHGIDSADEALYSVWFMGNPTLAWAGDPPKTAAGIDYWQTTGDSAVLLALRILYYAEVLEIAWSPLDLIEVTALGNRLTATGESYFENAIPSLRTMAPDAFSVSVIEPAIEELDYETVFGAVATSTVLAGSPVTLVEGANVLNPTGAGTIVFELELGTVGTVVGAVVTGTPVTIIAGTNTVTITGAGAITATVNLVDTTTELEDSVIGTGFDLTDVAADFGMSRWFFSGLVWLIMTVLICAAVLKGTASSSGGFSVMSSGKTLLVVFTICIVAGALLGLLKLVVAVGLFLAFGIFTGYVLFYRGASF